MRQNRGRIERADVAVVGGHGRSQQRRVVGHLRFNRRVKEDVLRAGASVVQVYTGFIYEGPGMVRRILPALAALLSRDGVTQVRDVIGAGARGG